ncbi:sigma-54-dependent Fis family transcriptional regulator [Vibrio quintilis]|uniref:Limonene hydroxylase n=1 Tax=Vibrio quintilis TaxID=1117707 RepID=A0A1M7YXD7_9VIBR|nr:sigma 54-interacting transcriptional regulator [Vibrio quintilis]SHO57262.1 Limonene hydroxylase [Vibrio quintilis]
MSLVSPVLSDEKNQQWYEEINRLPEANKADKLNEQLSEAWNEFLSGCHPGWMRTSILESWKRSLKKNVDPESFIYHVVPEDELAAILQKNRELIEVARGVMQDLLAYNPDGHINLTDKNGVTLCYCGLDLTPIGSVLSEDELGTNCTALCLIEERPVYLVSGENWKINLRNRRRQCAAAPVKNAQGKMLGVLTLTATQDHFNFQTLGTVQAAAQAIYHQLILQELLVEQRSILETLNEGVIVIDKHGMIKNANRYARQVFGKYELTGKHIDRELHPENMALMEVSSCNDCEVVFTPSPGYRISCLMSLMETSNGNRVISLKEDQRIRAITNRVMGVGASYTFERIIGNSSALTETIHNAQRAARSSSTVLLTGESGTGKELFAQAIHNYSECNQGPFIAVNCGAIPRELVQSELFGYVEGAYTGARKGGAPGKFELAEGGTLFLDEIGEMPLEAQTSLLRVLQEGEVVRVGAAQPNKINVRIVAATNCDLVKAVEMSAFRRDLYYRLNVISISIPALRERRDDIRDLIEFFSARICNNLKKIRPSFSPQALEAMLAYHWPGNVRELENMIERLVNLNSGLEIDASDLPDEMTCQQTVSGRDESYPLSPELQHDAHIKMTPASLEKNEKAHIINLLKYNRGNIRETAKNLDISRNCLYGKIRKWEISLEEFRGDK